MQQSGECCLTHEENHRVREIIEAEGLWWEDGDPPSHLSPLLMKRGWSIEIGTGMAPFVAVAVQIGPVKRVTLRSGAPLSNQAAALAHTLAHEILGHHYEVDVISTNGVRGRFRNRGVHPAHDRAAGAAAALLLIPDRYANGGYSVADIVSWCGVPTSVVMRRLVETVLVDDEPPSIIRIDRRGTERHWQSREAVPLKIGGVTE